MRTTKSDTRQRTTDVQGATGSPRSQPEGSEHTPGPWHISGTDENMAIVQTHHLTRDVWVIPRNEADMYLMAAAPDLLAAVVHLGGEGHRFGSVASEACADCVFARAAIAKARGR